MVDFRFGIFDFGFGGAKVSGSRERFGNQLLESY